MESVWTAGLVFAMDFMALGGRGCRQVCTYHWGDCIFGQNRWHTRKSVHFGVLLLSTGAAMRNTLQFNFYAHTLWLCFCINKKQILFVFLPMWSNRKVYKLFKSYMSTAVWPEFGKLINTSDGRATFETIASVVYIDILVWYFKKNCQLILYLKTLTRKTTWFP